MPNSVFEPLFEKSRLMRIVLLLAAFWGCLATQVYPQSYVLVTNAYSARVSKIRVATHSQVDNIQVADSVGVPVPNIGNIVVDSARNWAYVADHIAGAISVIDLNNWVTTGPTVIAGMGQQPIGMALNRAGTKLYVATRGPDGIEAPNNPLEMISISGSSFPPTLSHVISIPVGKHPINVVLSHDELYAVVTCRNQACFTVVNTLTNAVRYTYTFPNPTYEPEGIDLHPLRNLIYVFTHGQNGIVVFDLDSMRAIRTVPIVSTPPAQPSGGTFSPDGNMVLVSGQTAAKVFVFDTHDPYNPIQTPYAIPVGPQPHAALFIADTMAYIPNTNNTQPIGSISILKTVGIPTNVGLVAGTFSGPLKMVLVGDRDNDGISDGIDNCPFAYNPVQEDSNSNGVGDVCESPSSCSPGDANGDFVVDISDAVYLVSYIFTSGPPPALYPVCSGDANCDCIVDISDAVFLISYIFSGGSAPCSYANWTSTCGTPPE